MGKRRTGRKAYMPIEGANKRIFRRLIAGTSQYTRAPNGGNGTQFDSLCHRYLREVGDFLRDDPASVAADAAAAVSAVAASGAAINASRDGGSKKALEHQGRLECFVLEHAKETDVGKFYSSLWDVVGDGNTPTAAHRNNRLKYVPVDLSTLLTLVLGCKLMPGKRFSRSVTTSLGPARITLRTGLWVRRLLRLLGSSLLPLGERPRVRDAMVLLRGELADAFVTKTSNWVMGIDS